MTSEEMREYARRLVDDWPPLAQWQRDRLAVLLREPETGNRDQAADAA